MLKGREKKKLIESPIKHMNKETKITLPLKPNVYNVYSYISQNKKSKRFRTVFL